jgi:peptidyl-prolyl cis-trans isomerase D
MITWMQKHKKWLIVTIWISTIAFVGAGFVGWGSYNYGKSNSTIAIVGNKEISLKDLENEYTTLYTQYQKMLGENFNQELAKQFNLEDLALQRVIQKYLILNYADELGLMATDRNVAQELIKIDAFFKEGKFDKNTYLNVLKQNRQNPVNFESQLKQDILVKKLQNLFTTSLLDNEIKNISNLIFSENEVSLNILNDSNIKVKYTEQILKEYWNKNRENYKSLSGFEIAYNKIENVGNKTKKEMRKIALRSYLDLKKEKEEFKNTKTINTASTFLDSKDIETVISSQEGTILKPLYKDNNYYIIKLNKKVLPKVLEYNKVKTQVKSDFIINEKAKLLDEKAKLIMTNFSGKNLGYISRSNIPLINGLDDIEKEEFIKHLFSATNKVNKMNIGSKVLVYKITNSRLSEYDNVKDSSIIVAIENLKSTSLSSSLLTKLTAKYEVKSFMGKK